MSDYQTLARGALMFNAEKFPSVRYVTLTGCRSNTEEPAHRGRSGPQMSNPETYRIIIPDDSVSSCIRLKFPFKIHA